MATKKSGDLSKVDYDAITRQILDKLIAEVLGKSAPSQTPVDELEAAITQRANSGDTTPREQLTADILAADAGLRRRLEEFIRDRDGAHERALRAIIQRVAVAGGGLSPTAKSSEELDRRVRSRMSKSGQMDYLGALNEESASDPALEQAARRESTYASGGGTLADVALRKSTGAAAIVEQKVAALMQKSSSLDVAAAQRQVFAENPGLYDRWRAETSVSI